MAMKARLQGNAGNYRFRGAVWELGSFALRAYVHLIPKVARSYLHRSILSADGMTMQEVVGATKARVKYMVGAPVERFELAPAWHTPTTARSSTQSASDRLRLAESRWGGGGHWIVLEGDA